MVSGSWSISPQCVKVCMSPPKAQSVTASPVLTSYSVGQVVTYSCPTGSTLIGASTNHCLGNGQWLSSSPICGICSPPPFSGNLVYTPVQASYALSDTITYKCASGYTLVGNPQASCQATNSFAPSTQPTCSNTVCPQVPSVSGASFTPNVATTPNVAIGNTATYNCNTGFTLTGSGIITCSTGGVWTFPQGPTVCNPGCTAPPPITVGTGTVTAGTNFPVGNRVTYACTTPPTLVGSAESTCSASGWSTPPPECQAVCLRPTPAANVIIMPTTPTIPVSQSITFTCPSTHLFNPTGTSSLTCTAPSYVFTVPTTNTCLISKYVEFVLKYSTPGLTPLY
ncbi:C4b-binding protein-like [Ciona intestinalis]